MRPVERLSGSVGVGTMFDRDDGDQCFFIADAIDDPKVAASCTVQTLELQTEPLADAMWVIRERAVAELDHRARDLLR